MYMHTYIEGLRIHGEKRTFGLLRVQGHWWATLQQQNSASENTRALNS